MKRFIPFVLLFVAFTLTLFGWPSSDQIQNFPGANHGWDAASATWKPIAVSGDGKLVTDTSVTIGSISAVPEPPNNNSTTVVNVTSSAQNVASLANRQSVSIWNHSGTTTLWVSLDSTVASATVGASIPIQPYGFLSVSLDSSKVVGLVASVAVTATVYQDGY